MRRYRKYLKQTVIYILLAFFLVIFLFPIYWMFVSSFQPNSALIKLPPNFWPSDGTLDNYIRILTTPKYLTYYKNSAIVAFSTVAICILVSIFAGYAFSRYRFPARSALMSTILSIQMFPVVAILISLFIFFTNLKLINTYRALILADITIALPFSIWFLKSFFDTIPQDLEEAAYIDGCGRLRTIFEIVVPLILPGLLAVGIYSFLISWDDFIFGLTLINKDSMRTLPVGIAMSFLMENEYDWAGMMTVSVVASLPILILFVFLNRYMVAGLTQGSVKG
jgi:multiple sugar transport system permease protein